jgi:hypothetical protein
MNPFQTIICSLHVLFPILLDLRLQIGKNVLLTYVPCICFGKPMYRVYALCIISLILVRILFVWKILSRESFHEVPIKVGWIFFK